MWEFSLILAVSRDRQVYFLKQLRVKVRNGKESGTQITKKMGSKILEYDQWKKGDLGKVEHGINNFVSHKLGSLPLLNSFTFLRSLLAFLGENYFHGYNSCRRSLISTVFNHYTRNLIKDCLSRTYLYMNICRMRQLLRDNKRDIRELFRQRDLEEFPGEERCCRFSVSSSYVCLRFRQATDLRLSLNLNASHLQGLATAARETCCFT